PAERDLISRTRLVVHFQIKELPMRIAGDHCSPRSNAVDPATVTERPVASLNIGKLRADCLMKVAWEVCSRHEPRPEPAIQQAVVALNRGVASVNIFHQKIDRA